jgi:RHS repeat-associated protein
LDVYLSKFKRILLKVGESLLNKKLWFDNGSTTKEVLGAPTPSKTTDYVYDAQDRLIEVKNNNLTVAKYAYDPMGRRIWRETFGADASTTWFLYSDEGLIGEYNQNGAAVREYGWNPGGLWGTDPLWQKDASGVYLAHNDHLFTTDKLTKAFDGRVSWTAVREAFGKTAVAADSQVTYLLRFPGQWEDGVGEFSQNWWREYGVDFGRYLEVDLLDATTGTPNKYVYAIGAPITIFDNEGLLAGPSPIEYCKNPRNLATCIELGNVPSRPKPNPNQTNPPAAGVGSKEQEGKSKDSCNCLTEFPGVVLCEELPPHYLFSKKNHAVLDLHAAGVAKNQVTPATSGPCEGEVGSEHWKVMVNGVYNGSIFGCPCCVETAGGPVIQKVWGNNRGY